MSTTIAVVAAGAMGSAVGARLRSRGAVVVTTLAGRTEASVERARAAGMQDAPLASLAEASVFLSIVPPDRALALARQMAPALRDASTKAIYVDLNAVNPDSARQVAEVIEATGASFVDGGIIGGPPGAEGPGPTFYLSGSAAAAASVLEQHGLAVKQLEGGVGAASALKMSYAGITKGLIALASCMALAADRAGVGPALRQELAASQGQLFTRFGRAVPDMFSKAYRWVPEMREIEAFIGPDHPESRMLQGAAEFYVQIAADMAETRADVAKLTTAFAPLA